MSRLGGRVPPASPSARGPLPDAGFTLIELLVATSLVGLVMAALTTGFVSIRAVARVQSGQQAAAELATDGIETVAGRSAAELKASPPVDQTSPTRDGIVFRRTWSVTACWQPPSGGTCGSSQAAGYVPLLRVAVTVTVALPVSETVTLPKSVCAVCSAAVVGSPKP